MVDSTASVTTQRVRTQQLVAELPTELVTREVADLTSPGGSRPMRRSYHYQPTPPAQWFGRERSNHVHIKNAVERAFCESLFADARAHKKKYSARRRDKARRAKNVEQTGLARRVCESKAARTERGAKPRSRSPASPALPLAPLIHVSGLPDYTCLSVAQECESGFECAGVPVALAQPQECDACDASESM